MFLFGCFWVHRYCPKILYKIESCGESFISREQSVRDEDNHNRSVPRCRCEFKFSVIQKWFWSFISLRSSPVGITAVRDKISRRSPAAKMRKLSKASSQKLVAKRCQRFSLANSSKAARLQAWRAANVPHWTAYWRLSTLPTMLESLSQPRPKKF